MVSSPPIFTNNSNIENKNIHNSHYINNEESSVIIRKLSSIPEINYEKKECDINNNININNIKNNENSINNNIDYNKNKLIYQSENLENNKIIENNNNNKESKKGNRNKFLGIIIVILITVSQTGFSELSSFVVTGDYNSPFMVVELYKEKKELLKVNFDNIDEHSLNYKIDQQQSPPQQQQHQQSSQLYNHSQSVTILKRFKSKFKTRKIIDENSEIKSSNNITLKKLIIISIPMTILYITLNWLWVLSLSMTETSIATALFQSASVFCFFLSIIILKEKIRILKSLSILIFIGGLVGIAVATTSNKDSTDSFPNSILGDILMIISAALWGLYEVLTSKLIGDANRTIVNTFMGLIGLNNLIMGIPIIAILNFIQFELFIIPDSKTFIMILVNAIVGFSVLYLITWGLSVTSPLFVRSGELMTIPSTLIFDILIKKMKLPLLAIPGYILIVIGFILSVFIESKQIKKNEQIINQHQQQIIQQNENENEKKQEKVQRNN
ncbi:hypothetical protein ACTFIV_009868 [Dictyostelium citrinum]